MSDYTISMSWSRLDLYRQCPMKFKATHIDKVIPFDDTAPALVRGRKIHSSLEHFVMWLMDPDDAIRPSMPKEAEALIPMLKSMKARYDTLYPEKSLAITHEYEKIDWFGKPHQLRWRVIADLIIFDIKKLIVCDYKTGKIYSEYSDDYGQLDLSSLIFMSLYPNIEVCENSYLMIDHKKTITKVTTRDDVPRLKAHFDKEFEEVNADTRFEPKKNKYCYSCPIKEDCKYG